MASSERQDYLQNLLNHCLRTFDRKRQRDTAVLSGSVTVALGVAFPGKPEASYKNVALVLSALGAALNTWDAFFNHRTLWVSHTITANKMRSLKEEFEYCVAKGAGTISEEDAGRIFEEYRRVVTETNQAWEGLRKDEPTGTTRPS